MSMADLNEAATTVINRRLSSDDITYYISNMDPNRYQHQGTYSGFRDGYFEFRDNLLRMIRNSPANANQDINTFSQRVRNGADALAAQRVGDGRFSLRHNTDVWTKGFVYAYQELLAFLDGDEHNQGPHYTPVTGKTV